MSRGPGKIEQAIEAAFLGKADTAFTSDELCRIAYRRLKRIERKHRVSVIRAAQKVAKRLDWASMRLERRGGALVFFNMASLMSYAIARERANCPWRDEATIREILAPDGRDHHLIAEGGAWVRHWQMFVAEHKGQTDTDDYRKLCQEQ